jgi:hypothetical protein
LLVSFPPQHLLVPSSILGANAPSNRINVALIGCGNQSRVDLPNMLRQPEQVVFPLIGDGVDAPNQVALMGHFHVTHAIADESWVTIDE